MADLIGDVSTFHPSVSHAVNVPSPAGSDEGRPLVVDQAPSTLVVPANAGAATFSTSRNVAFDAKPASGMLPTLLTNQPSAVATSNRTTESTSQTKRASVGVKRSGLCKNFGVKRGIKAIEKPEKSGRRGEVVFPPESSR